MVDGVVGHFSAMVCLMGLNGVFQRWYFSAVVGCWVACWGLVGLGGVVGCASGLRSLIVGLWWLGC